MAKHKTEKFDEIEVTLMRTVAPERFDVVSGVIRGALEVTKVLERNVTLVVARGTARAAIDKQSVATKARLGLETPS